MFRRVLLGVLFAAGLAAVVLLAGGGAAVEVGRVTVEPLDCFEVEGRLVCVDAGEQVGRACVDLDATTVYCTDARQARELQRMAVAD